MVGLCFVCILKSNNKIQPLHAVLTFNCSTEGFIKLNLKLNKYIFYVVLFCASR